MTIYLNYSGNYNGFRHIIADNEIQLSHVKFVK
jgi:hypothetical protein